jgi:hypothetical protein
MFYFKLIDIKGPSQFNDLRPIVTSGVIIHKLHKLRLIITLVTFIPHGDLLSSTYINC